MMNRVYGMVFLGVPHRGSVYASSLNAMLAASMVASSKVYVGELDTNSPTIHDLNESFRLTCQSLQLMSFFETLKTNAGLGSKRIVSNVTSKTELG